MDHLLHVRLCAVDDICIVSFIRRKTYKVGPSIAILQVRKQAHLSVCPGSAGSGPRPGRSDKCGLLLPGGSMAPGAPLFPGPTSLRLPSSGPGAPCQQGPSSSGAGLEGKVSEAPDVHLLLPREQAWPAAGAGDLGNTPLSAHVAWRSGDPEL